MQIQIFNVPLTDTEASMSELNRFLLGHKVLEVEQRFYQNEKGACWSFCVRYLPTTANLQYTPKEKVDYKQVLSETEFAIFSKLREIRKQISTHEAVPAYAVFTDEELAGITKLPTIAVGSLHKVKGIGEKKVAKYETQFVEMYQSINQTFENKFRHPILVLDNQSLKN